MTNEKLSPLEAISNLKELRNVFVSRCKELGNTSDFIKVCEHKFDYIETALKQAQEDKEMLNVFKNALTIERNIPPELEIKESEKGCSYIFKEAVKIHESRIEEMLKKSLREWVLKNAFPKELKALEIIKEKGINIYFLKETDNADEYNELIKSHLGMKALTQEEFDLLKEVLL